MPVLWILILLTIFQFVRCQELVFANTICRHGDRNIYPPNIANDPWGDEAFWPEGYGQLTPTGKRAHYELGEYFLQRYAGLLGDGFFSADKVYVQSTDSDRSIMSGLATLASLFKPNDDEKFIPTLNWQPIPVHAIPFACDYLLATLKQCDRYDFEMGEFARGSFYRGLFEKYRETIEYLKENSGLEVKALLNVTLLYDTLYIEQLKGLCLPEWAEKIMVNGSEFEHLALEWFPIHTTTNFTKKIKGGFLLKTIFDRLSNKTQSTLEPDRSLWMYWAHDITLVNVLNSLGLYELYHRSPYSACLLFELYKQNDSHYVQLYYKQSEEVTLLEFPRCGSKCTLDELYDIYSDILPTKPFEEECKLRPGEILTANANPESYAI